MLLKTKSIFLITKTPQELNPHHPQRNWGNPKNKERTATLKELNFLFHIQYSTLSGCGFPNLCFPPIASQWGDEYLIPLGLLNSIQLTYSTLSGPADADRFTSQPVSVGTT
jgi:hypothetical protein